MDPANVKKKMIMVEMKIGRGEERWVAFARVAVQGKRAFCSCLVGTSVRASIVNHCWVFVLFVTRQNKKLWRFFWDSKKRKENY